MIMNDELQIHTKSLASMHLSQSFESYSRARTIRLAKGNPRCLVHSNACALSSIVHAFSALESFINFIGFEIFTNRESRLYIVPEKRGMLVHKMARSWDVAPALEKLQYLLAENRGKPIGANLENRLRELNLIRNWIAHGVSYTTTFLVEPDKQGSNSGFLVIDIEHSVNWQVKFPNTKFKMLEEIDHRDAEIAIKIVIDGLLLLTDAFEQPLLITNFEGERWYSIVFRDETNVGDLFFADD